MASNSLSDTFHFPHNHLIHSDTGNKVSKIYDALLFWLLSVRIVDHLTRYGSRQDKRGGETNPSKLKGIIKHQTVTQAGINTSLPSFLHCDVSAVPSQAETSSNTVTQK